MLGRWVGSVVALRSGPNTRSRDRVYIYHYYYLECYSESKTLKNELVLFRRHYIITNILLR